MGLQKYVGHSHKLRVGLEASTKQGSGIFRRIYPVRTSRGRTRSLGEIVS